METTLEQITGNSWEKEWADRVTIQTEIADKKTPYDQSNFLKKVNPGVIAPDELVYLSTGYITNNAANKIPGCFEGLQSLFCQQTDSEIVW